MSDSCTTAENNRSTTDKCKSGNGSSDCECNMPEMLLGLADQAWIELFKEKLKAEIQNSCGEKMDEIVKLVAKSNHSKVQLEIKKKVNCEEYKQNLQQLFASLCD